MTQVTNVAFFRARSGCGDVLGEALQALVSPTRTESECIDYDLHRSQDDPDVWFVYENWRSPAGLDAHMRSAHVKAFLERVPDVVDGEIELRRFTMVSARD